MPLQVEVTRSLSEVEEEIRSFEEQYGLNSDAFLAGLFKETISDFDAIDWNFLLMQRDSFTQNEGCASTAVFRGQFVTEIGPVDAVETYELIAA